MVTVVVSIFIEEATLREYVVLAVRLSIRRISVTSSDEMLTYSSNTKVSSPELRSKSKESSTGLATSTSTAPA